VPLKVKTIVNKLY